MASTFLVKIADLYPWEESVESTKVNSFRSSIQAGKDIPEPSVLKVDGEWLIVDGNNRVFAAHEEELDEITVRLHPNVSQQELLPYQERLKQAKASGQRGFNNVPVDQDASQRSQRMKQPEINVNELSETLKKLNKPI